MMMDRRDALIRLGQGLLFPCLLGAQSEVQRSIDRPIAFNTPEADRILAGLKVFPANNPWNLDVSNWPVHPGSRRIIGSIGAQKPLRVNPDMSFILVPPDQRRVPVKLTEFPDESDPGPYPVPDSVPIENWPVQYLRDPELRSLTLEQVQRDSTNRGGDRHAIVVDPVNRMLYEFYSARLTNEGWVASQASIFDLKSNRLRPDGWTSSDAAGLPIFPAIVRYDELERGVVSHALRVTVKRSRKAYVHPATHFASQLTGPEFPRMGERIRLRRGFSTSGFSPHVRVILEALKRHGMFVADNGIDWAISMAPDERIHPLDAELRKVVGADFEVVVRPRGTS